MTNANAIARSPDVSRGVQVRLIVIGALAVAAAAQIAIPIPGSAVPFTLQPLAVLLVGGLLGARLGAVSLVTYLALGAAGLPVFTPIGAPGFARLIGPTGGFLLSYPFAAATAGFLTSRSPRLSIPRCFVACLAGMVVIFAGGAAQLAVLHANVAVLLTPFLAADLVKALLAAVAIQRFAPKTRALR